MGGGFAFKQLQHDPCTEPTLSTVEFYIAMLKLLRLLSQNRSKIQSMTIVS